MATEQIGAGLNVKRLVNPDQHYSGYWLVFEEGKIAHPIVVLQDFQAEAFALVVDATLTKLRQQAAEVDQRTSP